MKLSHLAKVPVLENTHNPNITKKMLIGGNMVPGLTNYSQACFQPGDIAHGHYHKDMWEVFHIQKGSGIIRVDQQAITLEPGLCIIVEPGEHHEIENNANADLVINYFGIRT